MWNSSILSLATAIKHVVASLVGQDKQTWWLSRPLAMYYRAFVNRGKRRESPQWERRIVSFRIVENWHALLFSVWFKHVESGIGFYNRSKPKQWLFNVTCFFLACVLQSARKISSKHSLWWDFALAVSKNLDSTSTPPSIIPHSSHNHECLSFISHRHAIWWCTFSSHVEKRIHECRSAPQTVVHMPPCRNRLEVLFMLSQRSARNSIPNPGRHELADRVNG